MLFAKTLDDIALTSDLHFKPDDIYSFDNSVNIAINHVQPISAAQPIAQLPNLALHPPPPQHHQVPHGVALQHQKWLHHQQLQLLIDSSPTPTQTISTTATPLTSPITPPPKLEDTIPPCEMRLLPNPTQSLMSSSGDLSKPINALGPLCFSGFYLVSLTRTIVRNKTVPYMVRSAFMAPQLHFRFTVRDKRDHKWRHVPTVQIPYNVLCTAGDWLRQQLGVGEDVCTFKQIKDGLQKAVTDAWSQGCWEKLVAVLSSDFPTVNRHNLDDVLECESISGRGRGTPTDFFKQINCHKGAGDIRRDVDGAISARESLRWVLGQLGVNLSGCNISITKFREEVFPMWKQHCAYVALHSAPNCCQFYDGGYFKKIMIHKHLYNVSGCSSSYHVKDLFEGLDEVIKVWSNPTGMCVREAKCAAGLRYNVDKSFQSGIRSYSKSKFLEAAPRTAKRFEEMEEALLKETRRVLGMKQNKYYKCRKALADIEEVVKNKRWTVGQRGLGELMRTQVVDVSPGGGMSRKRKRVEREGILYPATPREQKRKHAHLSLKRKEANEQRVKQYLEGLREECRRLEEVLEGVKRHGEDCGCNEGEMGVGERFPTSANVPVA